MRRSGEAHGEGRRRRTGSEGEGGSSGEEDWKQRGGDIVGKRIGRGGGGGLDAKGREEIEWGSAGEGKRTGSEGGETEWGSEGNEAEV